MAQFLEIYTHVNDGKDAHLRFHISALRWFSMGLDHSDEGKLKINHGGNIGETEQFTLTHVGNLGIGTTSPNQKLDVKGYVVSAKSGSDGAFYLGNASHGLRRKQASNNVELFTSGGNVYLSANAGTTKHLTVLGVGSVDNVGNVGIGTTGPTAGLHILTEGEGLYVQGRNYASAHFGEREGAVFEINTNGAENLALNASSGGNVGIGTREPQAPLMVQTKAGAQKGGAVVLELRAKHEGGPAAGSGVRIDFTDTNSGSLMAQIRSRHESGLSKVGMSFHTLDGSPGERLRILSNGNVGIGTVPQIAGARLQVSGTVKATAFEGDGSRLIGTSSGWEQLGTDVHYSDGNVGIGTTGPTAGLHILTEGEGLYVQGRNYASAHFGEREGAVFEINTNGAENLALNASSGGNVGIGTREPSSKLHIAGGTKGTYGQVSFQGTEFHSHFFVGSNESTFIRPGMSAGNVIMDVGNVGIGTANPNPDARLHISGGNLNFDKGFGITWDGGASINSDDDGMTVGFRGGPPSVERKSPHIAVFQDSAGDVKARIRMDGMLVLNEAAGIRSRIAETTDARGAKIVSSDNGLTFQMHAGKTPSRTGNIAAFYDSDGTRKVRFTHDGDMYLYGGDIKIEGAGDCAEYFMVDESELVEPGTVLVVDRKERLRKSREGYDKRVVGVVSGAGGLRPGILLGEMDSNISRIPVALTGRVYCKVDARQAPIEAGDLLTTSSTPGYAMKAIDPLKGLGAVIGKALQPLKEGQSLIPIIVALQ